MERGILNSHAHPIQILGVLRVTGLILPNKVLSFKSDKLTFSFENRPHAFYSIACLI